MFRVTVSNLGFQTSEFEIQKNPDGNAGLELPELKVLLFSSDAIVGVRPSSRGLPRESTSWVPILPDLLYIQKGGSLKLPSFKRGAPFPYMGRPLRRPLTNLVMH